MIILPEIVQRSLLKLPEYGMGYQRAKITLHTGGTEVGIIVNAELFLKETEWPWLYHCDWQLVLSEARKTTLSVAATNLITRPLNTLKGVRRISYATARLSANTAVASNAESQAILAKSASAPAKDAPVTMTSIGEVFKRFSAYANDRRITAKKGVLAGTFATTKEDADAHIKTGTDAVSRYALENKKPASNVFTISPPKDTALQRGIVEPAYGEVGGGVEVIFVNDSPDGIVTGPVPIPDK